MYKMQVYNIVIRNFKGYTLLIIILTYWLYWEEEMATHSSLLAWRIAGTEEPGGLSPMGSHRVGHDLAAALAIIPALYNISM